MSNKFREKWIADWKKRISKLPIKELKRERERALNRVKHFERYVKAAKWNLSYIEKVMKKRAGKNG